jgi:hypothetical protein
MERFNNLDIVRVVELSKVQEVNTYIEQGWKLLSVRTEFVTEQQQQSVYVLGLPRSAQSPITTEVGVSTTQVSPQEGVAVVELATPIADRSKIVGQSSSISERTYSSTKSQSQSRRNNSSPTVLSRSPASPITLVTRIPLKESSPKRKRKAEDKPLPLRELTEEELREDAAWKEVQETGKPVLLGDKLFMPEGMSAWDVIQFLPEEMREQTHVALQHRVSAAFMAAVRGMREHLQTEEVNSEYEKFNAFPYPAQMAIAENIVRQQFGMPQADIRELLVQYGARLESDRNTSAE